MPDRQFVAPFGTKSAPADWTLQAALEIAPKMAHAKYDGSGAAGSYRPCLRLISDSGHVAAECVSEIIVAAGASADVSWFPGADLDEEITGAPTVGVSDEIVYYDTPNAGTPLTMTTTLLSGVSYVLVVEGTFSFWNETLTVGTPEANAMFPGSTAGRVSTQVGVDAEVWWAFPSDHVHPVGHQANLTMSLDGGVTFTHLEPEGGPYSTKQPGHLYRYDLVGQGHALVVKLLDIHSPDNYGKLRFTLQVPSGTGTGSGAGSLLPPADTTNNGQMAAVVSGLPTWSAVDGGSP
jgi:hypothetical protein